ncbi:PREDICTED: protein terminal ear1-like [Fragaria vesca subsp. vesca]|uniref:protein terminal ear1-like n=1 Tax=Fragaria vesca subsp. vesca TaxID=101020 RepID=UPI0002C345A9|nr:PREDICTED: protein terminal ear1-like [Fragaria vesca subsp. vesca]
MAETGFVRFQGGLDPAAEEFRPRNPNPIPVFSLPPPPPPLLPHHQVYYPYPVPPPPPPPPPPMNEVVAVPYVPSPAAYVSAVTAVHSPIPPPAAAPTRALLLRPVPCDVSEVTIRRELEAFGQVRWVQMERSCDGIVTVHFYDLRHAEKALAEIRELHMQHQARLRSSGPYRSSTVILSSDVWPHFVIPVHTAIPDGHNQGTIVIFNLDSAVTTSRVKQTFQAFGAVKELRETPSKKHQKFVEFFDVRHAARALQEMNGKEFHGKQIVIEFSRPGGNSWKKLNSLTNTANLAPPELYLPELPQTFSGHSRFSAGSPRMYGSSGPNSGFGNAHVESLMAELNLGGIEERESGDHSRRVSTKKQTGQGMVTSPRQLQPPPPPPPRSSRGKRGKQPKKFDARFLIKEDIMVESRSDPRTTLMIKNIPNKYSQKLLLSMLDNHCIHCNDQILRDGDEDQPLSSYDFIYLPIDFNNKCNVGYGFVNMTSPEATWRLYKAFHHQNWEVFNSRKICEVTYARVQGLEALKEHFKNSKFPSEMDHYLPVVFTPPRDGKRVTDPQPIFGVQHKSGSSNSSAINHPITLLLPQSHQHNHDNMDESTEHCSSRNGGEMSLNDDDDDDDQDS